MPDPSKQSDDTDPASAIPADGHGDTALDEKPGDPPVEDNIDELNESLQDLIIEYRIQEQLKNAEIDQDDDDDNDDDDANLQRILKQIGVSLHKKYRQKDSSNPSSAKLSDMIQQLYQTLKKTQPELFTKRTSSTAAAGGEIDKAPATEDTFDDDSEVIEEPELLTPEMQHANTLYHQAMKLINVTTNRQDEAYGCSVQSFDSLT